MRYIQEVEAPGLRDLFGWAKKPTAAQKTLGKDVLDKIQFVGSGKGAISLVLRYLSEKKVLVNRLDEIMVADWMGYGVYNQMQPHAFLAKKGSERTKAIFVYHQYGFPQNMEAIMKFAKTQKLVVIEDCAHALFSAYKGKRLGTFGDFAVYSFSKWVFCFALGGVTSKFKDFHAFAQKTISRTPFLVTFLKDAAKFLYERSRFSSSRRFHMYANLLSDASYAFYKEALLPSRRALRLLESKIGSEIDVRAKRYQYFLEKTNGLALSHSFEREGIVPYIIPVHCPEKKNKEIVDALSKIGVETGVYNFDMNRNMLSPRFVPCVLLPCHSGIPEELFKNALDLILKKL